MRARVLFILSDVVYWRTSPRFPMRAPLSLPLR